MRHAVIKSQLSARPSRVLVETSSRESSVGPKSVHVISSEPGVIVMPLDVSEHSQYALHFYLKFIHRPINKVHVCYVAENLAPAKPEEDEQDKKEKKLCSCLPWLKLNRVAVDVGPSPGVLAELEQKDKMQYYQLKAAVKKLFVTNNVNYEIRHLTGQNPAAAVLAYREEIGGTMILMGSRGEGALKRNIFGSVSEKVLHQSPVPVLVVKKPQGALQATQKEGVTTIH